MRKLIVAEFMSLDGVMQGPGAPNEDTEGGFTQGGWTLPYWHDDIGAHFFKPWVTPTPSYWGARRGRGAPVFETMEEGDPFGDVMKAKKKYVVSRTLQSRLCLAQLNNTRDNVIEEVRKLKQQAGLNISVDGSSVLIHALAQHNLIDESSLLVYPLVLGSGKHASSPRTSGSKCSSSRASRFQPAWCSCVIREQRRGRRGLEDAATVRFLP